MPGNVWTASIFFVPVHARELLEMLFAFALKLFKGGGLGTAGWLEFCVIRALDNFNIKLSSPTPFISNPPVVCLVKKV